MKKNILSSLLASVLFASVSLFGWSTYQYYEAIHSDDPITPYISVASGSVTIGRGDIAIDMTSGDRYNLSEKDIIMTKVNTFALVHWPDHSTTRLGSDSRMTINRMRVTEDYSAIEIEVLFEKGKAWNNVVRTIYPGSYFRAKLPDNNIIAWVRGTVFDINLGRNYIHSVDHSVSLSDGLGRVATLLPGDIASTQDILKRLGTAALDSAWIELNILQDTAENLIHSAQIEKSINFLKQVDNIWDRFVRWILSFFSAFKDIKILESLGNMDAKNMVDIPKEYILKWYQRFQDTKFVQERENIRTLITKTWTSWDTYIDAIARGALWDKMNFSWMTLKSADTLIGTYAKTIDTKIQWVLNVVPVPELQSKAKETLRSLLK